MAIPADQVTAVAQVVAASDEPIAEILPRLDTVAYRRDLEALYARFAGQVLSVANAALSLAGEAPVEPINIPDLDRIKQLAEEAHGWGDHRDIGYCIIDTQGRLPAVSGALLTELPESYSVIDTAALSVANTAAETVIGAVTLPTGVAGQNGAVVRQRLTGAYLNNTGGDAGFTLSIKVGATTIYSDLYNLIPSAAGARRVLIDLEWTRTAAALALLDGLVVINNAGAATTGVGDGAYNGIRSNVIGSADTPFAFDWSSPPEISITMTLSTAAATHTFARTALKAYCDRYTLGAVTPPPVVPEDKRDYLEDQPVEPTVTRTFDVPLTAITGFPKEGTSTVLQQLSTQQLSTKALICGKPFGSTPANIAAAQAIRPITYLRIISSVAYQGYTEAAGGIGSGHNFDGSGPTSGPGVVWAGHWLYLGGTTTTSALTTTGTTVSVADAARIEAGRYVVIYNGAWGSFTSAEHCLVNTKTYNASTGYWDLGITRGYKSTAATHPSGARIAQHAQGNGADARLWRYNLGTNCPLDGAGRKFNQYLALWVAQYYDMYSYTTPIACAVHGIVLDSDFGIDCLGSATGSPWDDRAIDENCDGTADWGFVNGVNSWAAGLNEYFTNLRAALDARGRVHAIIQGGESNTVGHGIINGVQKEAAMSGQMSESGSAVTKYQEFGRYVSISQAHQATRTSAPRIDEVMEKVGTLAYPPPGGGATSNAPARLSLAWSCIEGGLISFHNWSPADADRYYDELAVNLTPGADYGKAIAKTDFSGRRTWAGWLGAPLAPYQRVYSYTAMAPENAILAAGFETNTTGWSGTNAVISRSTTQAMEGTASLKAAISATLPNLPADNAARILGPTISLAANTEYTLCFSVKADRHGRVRPVCGGQTANGIYVTPGAWARRIWTFRTGSAWTGVLSFDCGTLGAGDLYLDAVYLFAGNADVFMRKFTNGIVVVNATPSAKTVALGATYQRIRGTGQDPINDGSSASSVTIAPWDAYIGVLPA